MTDELIQIPKNIKLINSFILEKKMNHVDKYQVIEKNDFIILLQEQNFKFNIMQLDQGRHEIRIIIEASFELSDRSKLYDKYKKIFRAEKSLFGYKVFSPTHKKMLWMSKIDYEFLTKDKKDE